jgi:hypothetical protein
MVMAADLDWCGAGGAAHHARWMSRVWLPPYIERYIYVRREVEHVEFRPSHLINSRTANLLIVKVQHHFSLFLSPCRSGAQPVPTSHTTKPGSCNDT